MKSDDKLIFVVGGDHINAHRVISQLSYYNVKIHYYTDFKTKELFEISKKKDVDIYEITDFENIILNYSYVGGVFMNRIPENWINSQFFEINKDELEGYIIKNTFFHLGFMKSILKQRKSAKLKSLVFLKIHCSKSQYNRLFENIYNVLIPFSKLEFDPLKVRINQIIIEIDSFDFDREIIGFQLSQQFK